MRRDLVWLAVLVGGTFGAALLNERFNLANPQLEQQLIGCWAGSTGSGNAFSGAAVLQVNADNTFTERAVERLVGNPKFVSASGTWKVQKDRWILEYNESTASFMFPRAGRSLRLIVVEVTDKQVRAKIDYAVQAPFQMSRVASQGKDCQPRSS